MYASLDIGEIPRTMTTADLNVADTDNGTSALHAFLPGLDGASFSGHIRPGTVEVAGNPRQSLPDLGLGSSSVLARLPLAYPNHVPGASHAQLVIAVEGISGAAQSGRLPSALGTKNASALGDNLDNGMSPLAALSDGGQAIQTAEATSPVFFLGLQQSRSLNAVLEEASNQLQQTVTDNTLVQEEHADLIAEAKVPLLENSLVNLLALSLGAAAIPALISDQEQEDRESLKGRDRVIRKFGS